MFNKISNKFGRIMVAAIGVAGVLLFALIFCASALYYASACKRGVYPLSDVPWVASAVGVTWMFLWTITERRRMNSFWTAVWVSLFVFVAHVFVIRLTHALHEQVMFSDFLRVQNCVEAKDVRFSHLPFYFYWCNFELLVSILGKIFCRDMQVVQYLNALACSLAVIPLYRLSERASNRGLALLAALLFGLSPSMLMYSTILTSEFVGMALLFWAAWFFIEMLHSQDDWRRSLAMAVTSGILLAGCQLMKPVAILFVCATGVLVLRMTLQPGKKRAVVFLLGCFLVMLVVYKCVFVSGQHAFSEIAGPKVELKENISIPRALAVGLNVDSGGAFDTKFCSKLYNMSEQEVRAYFKEAVKRDLSKYPSLFVRKFSTLYSNEWWGFGCYVNSFKVKRVPAWMPRIVDSWYVLTVIISVFGAVGLLLCLFKRGMGRETWPGMLSLLILLAFTALEMLIEVQGRYRSIVYPFYFMLIPYCRFFFGADNPLIAKIGQMLKRRRHV